MRKMDIQKDVIKLLRKDRNLFGRINHGAHLEAGQGMDMHKVLFYIWT